MMNVINPIQSEAMREGTVADVIHAIAQDMMERRSHLLNNSVKVPKGEARVYRKQSRLLEEYATALEAIYYQLEPAKWNPESLEDLFRFAQAHQITLPVWMFADPMKAGKTGNAESKNETTGEALDRFENEGGRI